MKYVSFIITGLLTLSVVLSCENESLDNLEVNQNNNKTKIIGEGDLVNKIIEVDTFNKLENIGLATITVKKSENQKITLRAQQNVLDVMTYAVNNNKLEIGVEEGYSVQTKKGIFIDIEAPTNIEEFNITGSGNIELDNSKQPKIDVNIVGAGNFDSYKTEIEQCKIQITGSGNCNVFVTKKLTVNIVGMGNVNYIGKPVIEKSIVGIGSVIDNN